MRFITNIEIRNSFQSISSSLNKDLVTEVVCAVAYADNSMELLDFCYKNQVKLTFFGRYDKTIPVSIPVLESFSTRRSEAYRCFLIKEHFHPKVYWFKGFGVYIGSANMSSRAWIKNIEAGLFLSEEEIEVSGLRYELEDFFQFLESPNVSTRLNDDILSEIKKQSLIYSKPRRDLESSIPDSVSLIAEYKPSIVVDSKTGNEKRKEEFLREWNSTLDLVRAIADLVSRDEYRPTWVPKDTPAGVQADQFLHSFYYERTRAPNNKKRYLFMEHFEKNKNDIEGALRREMAWWKSLPTGPVGEEQFITRRAPRIKALLERKALSKMTKNEFIELCGLFHSFNNIGRYYPPNKLGFPDGYEPKIEEKIPKAASIIFDCRADNGMSVTEILSYVLYSGPQEHIVHRLFDAFRDPKFHIPRFGRSCYGELIGWALPDSYPPRNDRTNKALKGLGYNVVIWNEGDAEH